LPDPRTRRSRGSPFCHGDRSDRSRTLRARHDHPDTVVYLALPPGLLTSVLPALARSKLGGADAVAIEKPFGTDLASARHLNEVLRIQLPKPTISRIDHFLSNELVHRVIVLPLTTVSTRPSTPGM
jgi:glucose-6-phosphate 1-dehydrogenase